MASAKEGQGRFGRAPDLAPPVRATVIARWEADRGLLRTDVGTVFSVTVPETMRRAFDVGVEAWIVLDVVGRLNRWFLDDGGPDASPPEALRTL